MSFKEDALKLAAEMGKTSPMTKQDMLKLMHKSQIMLFMLVKKIDYLESKHEL